MASVLIKSERLTLIPVDQKMLEFERNKEIIPDSLKDIIIPDNWPHESVTKEVTKVFIGLLLQNRLNNFYWVYRNNSRERILIGSGGIIIHENGVHEIGYSVLKQFENKGFATEAIGAIVRWFVNSNPGSVITAKTGKENFPSIKVLEKNGFSCSGSENDSGLLIYSLDN